MVAQPVQSGGAAPASRIFRCPYPDVDIPHVSLPDLVLARAKQFGDKPALIDQPSGRTITYAALAEGVRCVAAGLAARGLARGDVLGIFSPNVPEYAIAFHAVASLGGICTTVNPLYTTGELAQQLNDAGAKFLLTTPSLIDKARDAAARVPTLRELFVFGEADGATSFATLLASTDEPPRVSIDPQRDLVVLPYSSGTTGLPKGVMLTHHNLVAELTLVRGRPDVVFPGESDTLLAFLPFFHVYGICVFLSYALWQGATIVVMPRFDLEQFLESVQRYGVTYLHLVPPIVLAMAKHPMVANYDLSRARWALSAAAPLGQSVAEAFTARLGTQLIQAYGMTEVSGATHVGSCAPGQVIPQSGGRLVPNTECMVVDLASGQALGSGEQGELWLRGPLTMRGYLGQPEATAATIDADGWLHTGDVGYVDERGDTFIVDRVKELIKFKALQVAPAELEAVLLAHPAVADVAVIPSPDEESGEVPKAFVVLRSPATAAELMAFVAGRVAPHKKVREVEFVETIPKSASGKILRRILIGQERERRASIAIAPA